MKKEEKQTREKTGKGAIRGPNRILSTREKKRKRKPKGVPPRDGPKK